MTLMQRRRLLMESGSIIDGSKLSWEIGTINSINGKITTTSTTYITTTDYYEISNSEVKSIGPTADESDVPYNVFVAEYDENKKYIRRQIILSNNIKYNRTLSALCKYVKFTIGYQASFGKEMVVTDGQYFKATAKLVPAHDVIWLYNNGVISDILGSLTTLGYQKNNSYFTQSIGSTYLYIKATSNGGTSSVKGGRTYTSTNKIPVSYVGKTLFVRGRHKNTTTSANDFARVYISDSVQNASNFSDAFTNNITTSANVKTEDFTEFAVTLALTKNGYFSLVGQKNGGGYMEFEFKEAWME